MNKKSQITKLNATEIWLLKNLNKHIEDGALNVSTYRQAMIDELGVSYKYADHATITIGLNLQEQMEKQRQGEIK
jgi:hypothetical protein